MITEVDCPLCGVTVRQVASATLSLALWQHVNWACESHLNIKTDAAIEQLKLEGEVRVAKAQVELLTHTVSSMQSEIDSLRQQLTSFSGVRDE